MIEPQKDYRLCSSRSRRFKSLLVKERYWHCLYQVDKLRFQNNHVPSPPDDKCFYICNFFYYYTEKGKLFFTFANGQHGFRRSIWKQYQKRSLFYDPCERDGT
jgi:hypothetical protein